MLASGLLAVRLSTSIACPPGSGITASASLSCGLAAMPSVPSAGWLLGPGLIGAQAAITIDAVLWPLGMITGLASSLAVPYLMFTRLQAAPDAAFGGG